MAEDKDKVTDISEANKGEEPVRRLQDVAPTHQALPIDLVSQIVKYLKKQPMEDVEDMVVGMRMKAVPLALSDQPPSETG